MSGGTGWAGEARLHPEAMQSLLGGVGFQRSGGGTDGGRLSPSLEDGKRERMRERIRERERESERERDRVDG